MTNTTKTNTKKVTQLPINKKVNEETKLKINEFLLPTLEISDLDKIREYGIINKETLIMITLYTYRLKAFHSMKTERQLDISSDEILYIANFLEVGENDVISAISKYAKKAKKDFGLEYTQISLFK